MSSLWVLNESTDKFELVQEIPTDGAEAAGMFEGPDGQAYLIVANYGDRSAKRYLSKSTLWRQVSFNTEGQLHFEQVAEVESFGATAVEHFVWRGRHYVALSNEGDVPNRLHQSSVIYMLNVKQNYAGWDDDEEIDI